MVVVSDRRRSRSCTLVSLVGLVELAEHAALVALVAGRVESRTPGTIVEIGSSRWESGCSLVCCMCMMVRTVQVVEGRSCLAGVQGRWDIVPVCCVGPVEQVRCKTSTPCSRLDLGLQSIPIQTCWA
jgi:hypothetical protein